MSFGTILSGTTKNIDVIFKNTGTDCCVVTGVSPSAHFQVVNPPSDHSLSAGASHAVTIQFKPNSDVGIFNEQLKVTRNPPNGIDTILVSGESIPPQPHLTVNTKVRPQGDPGKFNLQIDGTTLAANVGDGGTTGRQAVSANVAHIVNEIAGTSTNLASYTVTSDCAPSVTLQPGDDKTCTITNQGLPRLTVKKILVPSSDPGRFDLQVDGITKAANVGNGGSVTAQVMLGAPYIVSEIASAGTSLSWEIRHHFPR